MKYLHTLIFSLLFMYFGCAQPPASNENEFYEKAINGESVYIETDTTMILPIVGKRSQVQTHLEILWDADGKEGAYLAEYSFGGKSGSRLLCKCSKSEMIPFLEAQYQTAKSIKQGKFSLSFNTGDMNFQSKNCLLESLPLTPKYDRPVLSELMSGNFKQNIKSEYLDIPLSSEFYVVNNKARIYLEGNIPGEDITFIGLGEKHRLQSIKTLDGKLIYPPQSSPDWKKSLFSKGYFTGNIIPSSSNWAHQTTFGLNEYVDQGIDIGIVINVDENLKNIENGISIKGSVEVMVDKGKDTTFQTQLPFYKPGKISLVKTKNIFSVTRKDEIENEGSFSIGDSNGKKWDHIKLVKFNISSKEQTVIANIKNDDKQFMQEIELSENERLYLEMKVTLPESMYIPVDLTLDNPILKPLKLNELKLQHYSISKSDNTANASVKFEMLAPSNKLLSVSALETLDNNGNILEANHKISRDNIFGNDAIAEYKLDLSIGKLPRDVEYISIMGKLNIDDGSYPPTEDINTLTFQETISLSGEKESFGNTPDPSALKPFNVKWSSIDYVFNGQGLTASFYVPKEKDVTFLNVWTEKSKVRSLTDSQHNDLRIRHTSAFSDRFQYLKSSTTRYVFDHKDDINKENQLVSYIDRSGTPVSFSIIQYEGPSTNFIQGEVELTLSGYKNSTVPKRRSYSFEAVPRQIDLQVGEEVLTFTNGNWGERDKDGNQYTKYSKYDYTERIHLSSIKVYDTENQLLSIAVGKDYNNLNADTRFLVINKNHTGPVRIDIEYYELKEYKRIYPVEISFNQE